MKGRIKLAKRITKMLYSILLNVLNFKIISNLSYGSSTSYTIKRISSSSSLIRRRTTTGVKVRLAPYEIINYLNRGHNNNENKKEEDLLLIPEYQAKKDELLQKRKKLTASINPIREISKSSHIKIRSQYEPTGTITFENNFRGFAHVQIFITDLPDCTKEEECHVAIYTGRNCSKIGSPFSSWDSLTYVSQNAFCNDEFRLKASVNDNYHGQVIALRNKDDIPIACGIFQLDNEPDVDEEEEEELPGIESTYSLTSSPKDKDKEVVLIEEEKDLNEWNKNETLVASFHMYNDARVRVELGSIYVTFHQDGFINGKMNLTNMPIEDCIDECHFAIYATNKKTDCHFLIYDFEQRHEQDLLLNDLVINYDIVDYSATTRFQLFPNNVHNNFTDTATAASSSTTSSNATMSYFVNSLVVIYDQDDVPIACSKFSTFR